MIAEPHIPQREREEIIHRNWGDTDDIISVIMQVVNKEALGSQVEEFSKPFRASRPQAQYEKLRQLWKWVKNNIPYVADPNGVQIIKHPARTWEDAKQGRGADCKSMTVFVRFVLYNLGIPHVIRFSSYVRSGRIQHVYAVAIVGGKDVIIDTVHTAFDEEVPATRIKDIKPDKMTKIIEIAGLRQNEPVQLPERPYLPLSQMTKGELELALKVRELEMLEAINRSAGFEEVANEQEQVLHELEKVLKGGLHIGGLSFSKLPKLRRYFDKLARMDNPCYLSHAILGEFDATDEQEAFCRQQARAYANSRAQAAGYRGWNGQGSMPAFTGRNIPDSTFIDLNQGDQFPYGQTYEEKLQDCLSTKEMENVVNAHLVDAGPNFLYDQMGAGNYNTTIAVKRINQNAWTYTTGEITGLGESTVRSMARLGTIEKMTQEGYPQFSTPEAAKEALYPYMQDNPNIGIAFATIVGIVSAIVSLVATGVKLVQSFEQASRAKEAFQNISDPGSPDFQIRQEDFLLQTDSEGNPIPPVPGNTGNQETNNSSLFGGLMSDPVNLALLGAGLYLFTQKSN